MKEIVQVDNYLEEQRSANAALANKLGNPILWNESVWHIRGDQEKPYDMTRYPYMREPGASRAPKLAIMASGGSGKTEFFLGWANHRADKGRRVLYAFETDQKTGLIVNERVNPNLESSLYLQTRCSQTDNIKFKKYPQGFLYLMGMGKDSAVTSIHVDDLVLDELDLMEPEKRAAAKKRLASSADPCERSISNPWSEGGGIHAEFLAGDQRLWNVVCPHCKVEAPLRWETHLDMQTATVRCPKCFKSMDRLTPGRWKATNAAHGEFPSYHMHGLFSPELDLVNVCKEIQSDDLEIKKAAHRFNMGIPLRFEDGGLSDLDLHRADGGNLWTKYAPGGFMTVDPGGLFDVQIYQKQEAGKAALCTWFGTVKNWVELRALVEESRVDGGTVDYGPETKAALEFCEDQAKKGRDFRRIAYKLQEAPGTPDFMLDPVDVFLIAAQRTGVIDQMVQDLRKGKLLFPTQAVRTPTSRWATHMKAPQRSVAKDAKGNDKGTWDEGSKPDHQFHCAVQACIWTRIPNKGRRKPGGVSSWAGH